MHSPAASSFKIAALVPFTPVASVAPSSAVTPETPVAAVTTKSPVTSVAAVIPESSVTSVTHVTSLATGVAAPGRISAKVDPQLPAEDDLVGQLLLGSLGARDVDEFGVGESSGLSAAPVNRHSDVDDVPDVLERVVEVLVAHLERHVADEQGLGRRVDGERATITVADGAASFARGAFAAYVVLDCNATAGNDGLVHFCLRPGRCLLVGKLDEAESVAARVVSETACHDAC